MLHVDPGQVQAVQVRAGEIQLTQTVASPPAQGERPRQAVARLRRAYGQAGGLGEAHGPAQDADGAVGVAAFDEDEPADALGDRLGLMVLQGACETARPRRIPVRRLDVVLDER
ncbi:hypothetical protein OJ997_34080 [Solirubrobacter phytolaccae]|uniref:Uncharacterized protein n=1 Tax=Solirubrobacter phytolaccae TaxID=1404360 RepID=A0A9X3NI87_9ACTN|nr:hypothetical protein [Solirubrobacter phytolaccae]MDA0185385.1 hypothetical protein [Solirubrobacter phytolaccae]